MKSARAKIEDILDVLLEELLVRFTSTDPNDVANRGLMLDELKRLTELSNLNTLKIQKQGREPGPQSKVHEVSDDELLDALKSRKPKDLFPRRGPPHGKRPGLAPPPEKPEPKFCDIHTGVVCLGNPNDEGAAMWVCPECAREPAKEFLSLKDLLK